MRKKSFKLALLLPILLLMITSTGVAQKDLPTDKKATKETVSLYHNLKRIAQKSYLFGHQDATAYGIGWKEIENKSDVKDVTGEFPGLYGWDLSGIELMNPKNIIMQEHYELRKQHNRNTKTCTEYDPLEGLVLSLEELSLQNQKSLAENSQLKK